MVEKRYRAFISYSQRDKAQARRLHRALETYRLPRGVEAEGVDTKTRKLGRFFRDDEEMGAATDLGAALQGAIADAESLIVICSPHAAQSRWVNEEIVHFKRTGRADRIFAVIVGGQPHTAEENDECFPPALRFELDPDGALTDRPAEPLALDVRKESYNRLVVRLAAGLMRTPFDTLWRREQRRTRARAAGLSSAVFIGALVAGVATVQIFFRPHLDAWLNYQRFAHSGEELRTGLTGMASAFQDCRDGSSDCPVMVVIPDGAAMIGAAADDPELGGSEYTLPLQRVAMPRFAVSQHEIRWAEWTPCVAARRCPDLDRSGWEGDDRPVINVSWTEARAYADWLKEATGEDYRLLTEHEWEYAARGVTSAQTAPTRFSWGDTDPVCDTAAENGAALATCEQQSTFQAGSFQANAFGLHDMHGNVWEWTETCSDASPTAERPGDETHECSNRVLRGGAWFTYPPGLRSANRYGAIHSSRYYGFGFRVARTL